MKFHIQKDLVTQVSCFKSRSDPVSLGELGGTGNLGKRLGKEWRNQDETWWEEQAQVLDT